MDVLLTDVALRAEEAGRGRKFYVGEDGLRHCCVCHEALQTVVLGRTVSCTCRCDAAREQQEKLLREQEKRRARVRAMTDASPFYNPDYARCTFAADRQLHNPALQSVAAFCRKYVAHWYELGDDRTGILLSGPVGTGKTFYAGATVNGLCEQGIPAIIVTTSRFLNVLRSRRDPQEAIDGLNRFALVALDDLGAERMSDASIELMEDFLDARLLAKKPLLVTTNLCPDEIRHTQDQRLKRMFDRVCGLCGNIVPMVQKTSLRVQNALERAERCRKRLEELEEAESAPKSARPCDRKDGTLCGAPEERRKEAPQEKPRSASISP